MFIYLNDEMPSVTLLELPVFPGSRDADGREPASPVGRWHLLFVLGVLVIARKVLI